MDCCQLLQQSKGVTIIQDQDGEISWKQLKTHIAGTQQVLLNTQAQNCAIFSHHATTFISAFLACTYLGIDVILPPDQSKDMLDCLKADCYIGDFDRHQKVKPLDKKLVDNVKQSSITIFTSGSTGKPKAIKRKLHQLLKEVDEINAVFAQQVQPLLFVSTVSYQHIYGLLFSILWPLTKGHMIKATAISYEESLQKIRKTHQQVVLISSPAFLKRINEKDTINKVPLTVFCSGGVLTDHQHKQAALKLTADITQVYGSTETGGIAYKTSKNHWQFFPSVKHKVKSNLLFISSPFCYTEQWHNTHDLVSEKKTGFVLLGRNDRIVKIEEKRVSLIGIEEVLLKHHSITSAHVIYVNEARQYVVAAIVLSTDGRKTVEKLGEKTMKQDIKSYLKNKIEKLAVPKKIRFIEEIPVNSQGKVLSSHIINYFQ